MKKITLILSALFFLSSAYCSTKLSITNVALSDSQIYPGQSGTISFEIKNLESTDLTNVRIIPNSLLTMIPSLTNIGTMKPGESKFIVLTYLCPLSMPSGSYSISVEAKYDSGGQQLSSQSGATVRVMQSNSLVIENYTTNLLIDSENEFNLTVSNQGNDVLNDLFINVLMPNGFIPLTGSEFYISSLSPGQIITISSKVFIDKEIEPKPHQFLLRAMAGQYSLNSTLNFLTIGAPKIAINSVNLDPKIISSGNEQTVSCQIENIGSSKAYGIKAELLVHDDFKGIKYETLGALDREDITSAIFEIVIPSSQKNLAGEVRITYYDSKGAESIVSQQINYEIIDGNGTTIYLIIVVFAIAGLIYLGYVKMKKKK